MEVNSTTNVRITMKEANDLANKIMLRLLREYPLEETFTRKMRRISFDILNDYEFEQEVTVNIEPEERTECEA